MTICVSEPHRSLQATGTDQCTLALRAELHVRRTRIRRYLCRLLLVACPGDLSPVWRSDRTLSIPHLARLAQDSALAFNDTVAAQDAQLVGEALRSPASAQQVQDRLQKTTVESGCGNRYCRALRRAHQDRARCGPESGVPCKAVRGVLLAGVAV